VPHWKCTENDEELKQESKASDRAVGNGPASSKSKATGVWTSSCQLPLTKARLVFSSSLDSSISRWCDRDDVPELLDIHQPFDVCNEEPGCHRVTQRYSAVHFFLAMHRPVSGCLSVASGQVGRQPRRMWRRGTSKPMSLYFFETVCVSFLFFFGGMHKRCSRGRNLTQTVRMTSESVSSKRHQTSRPTYTRCWSTASLSLGHLSWTARTRSRLP